MRSHCMERDKIFAFAQQMLSGREERQVTAHLKGCERCQNVLRAYQQLDSLLGEWSPAAEPSPWFDARLRAAVGARTERQPKRFLGLNWSRWMAAPALASLLLVAGLVLMRDAQLGNHASSRRAPTQTVVKVSPATLQTQAATQELRLYQNLPMLEDYDMLANFDVISELPKGNRKIAD